jgi:hypothetical protein
MPASSMVNVHTRVNAQIAAATTDASNSRR